MEEAIFSRLVDPRGVACRLCHEDRFAPQARHHYTGAISAPVPESLVREGAAPPGGLEGPLDCRTCHLAHGTGASDLLVNGREGPCKACHGRRDHAWDPLEGLLTIPEEKHTFLSKSAVEKQKAEVWDKRRFR